MQCEGAAPVGTATSQGLNFARGRSALIGSGASISGPVTVQAGGALEIDGAHITGPLKFSGAAQIRVCNTTITGPTTVTGAGGLVTFGDGTVGCPGNRFTGPVRITNGTGGVIFDHNTITGPLTITGNTGTLPPPRTGTVEAMTNTATGEERGPGEVAAPRANGLGYKRQRAGAPDRSMWSDGLEAEKRLGTEAAAEANSAGSFGYRSCRVSRRAPSL
jgi:hypothetical protein